MGSLRVKNEVILAKIESVYNTDPVPVAATNAVLVRNLSPASEGLRMNDRAAIRGSLGTLQYVFGGKLQKLSFEIEAKGSGTAGTAPEIGPLLRACALGETIVGATSVTYKPVSTNHESVTIYWYEGGRNLHKLTGARGTCKFTVTAGGLGLFQFEFTGHYTAPTTTSSQPTPTYNATVPKAALSLAVTLGGTAVVCREYTIDLGNKLVIPPSLAASDGYADVLISDRDVQANLTVESELYSTIDFDTLLPNGTGSTLAGGTLGGTAGNRLAIASSTSGAVVQDMSWSEGEGLRLRQIPLRLKETSAGDDEVSFAFT
jgi:hypothetical protein